MDDSAKMPKILEKVLSLVGKWESDATLKMGGQSYKFKYTFDFKKLPHGQGLSLEEGGEIPGVGTLMGSNIIGYNPYDGKLHWFTVDNFGTTHDHIGELPGKNHLTLLHESQKEGKDFKEMVDMFWKSKNEVEVKLVATLGDEVEEELNGVFQKL